MDYVIYVLAFIGVLFLIFAIWVFRIYMDVQRNKKKPKGLEIMPFKDNEAAFEMASKYMDTDIILDKPTVAISLQDMKKPSEPIMIKVAGEPPFSALAATYYTENHLIQKGDLLGVMPFKKVEYKTSYMMDDERKEWLFLVISELNPKFHATKQMWSVKNDFLIDAAKKELLENSDL